MEVTLEKIELVKDRTGVSYKEAKEALESADGSVVDAIINIEENIDELGGKSIGEHGSDVAEKVKELVNKGNVSRIVVRKTDGETLINLPVTAGVVATLIAPGGVLLSMIASFGFKCTVEVVKTDGTIIDVSDRANDAIDRAKEKSADLFDAAKEKGQDMKDKVKGSDTLDKFMDKAGDMKEKVQSSDTFEKFKDKAGDVKDKVQSSETYEKVMDKAGDAFEKTSEKVDSVKSKFSHEGEAEEMAEEFAKEFEEMEEVAAEAADDAAQAAEEAVQDAQDAAQAAAETAEETAESFEE